MPKLKPLHAVRKFIEPGFYCIRHAMIDGDNLRMLREHLKAGGEIPPVVVLNYGGDAFLPIDGHHRMIVSGELGRGLDSWQVDGKAFDRLTRDRLYNQHDVEVSAEELVLCDGVPAYYAAQAWRIANDPSFKEIVPYRLWSERTF